MADTNAMLNWGVRSEHNKQGYEFKEYPKMIDDLDNPGKKFAIGSLEEEFKYYDEITPEGRKKLADKEAADQAKKLEELEMRKELERNKNARLVEAKHAAEVTVNSKLEEAKKKAKGIIAKEKRESKKVTDNTELFETQEAG